MRTIEVSTELDADADRVWTAMQHPATFLYVCRGLIGIPALAGRSDPFREGECGTGWLFLFHLVPLSRHTILLADVDGATRTMRSREHGGLLQVWNHTLHVEPLAPGRSRYTDAVEIDAGIFTNAVARVAVWIYRYRQARWRRLAGRHLQDLRSEREAGTGRPGRAPGRHRDEPSGEEPWSRDLRSEREAGTGRPGRAPGRHRDEPSGEERSIQS